ncbi:YncE family protein [Microbulbifer sp. A4B17]|uniref:YncE family protein n=1 Tax=Microbulbifer sp. A4B17 TaxID=359370 RepID=UPI00130020A0|nr:WD40 repeat domain-containing protein [Microbulbifer sp. A4B17]
MIRSTLSDFPPVPHELTISPDRKEAYVPIYGPGIYGSNPNPGHLIAVIDLVARQHRGYIDINPYRGPHTMKFGPDGLLYSCAEASGVVVIIDIRSREVIGAIDARSVGCHRLVITPDGTRLFTENEDADPWASVIDLKKREFSLRLPTPNGAAGIDLSPGGELLVISDGKVPDLVVFDAIECTQITRISLSGHQCPAQIVRFSPDGKWLIVTNMDGNVATIIENPPYGRQHLVPTGKSPMDMAFHPNGQTVVIGNQGDGTLSVIDLPSKQESERPKVGVGVEALGFF